MERHYEKDEQAQSDWHDFKQNFDVFWGRFGNLVTIILVLGATLYAGIALYTYFKRTNRENAWYQTTTATSPAAAFGQATENKNPAAASMLALRAGDLYFGEAQDLELDAAQRETSLERAEQAYQLALDEAADPTFAAVAHLGLAAVAEQNRDLDAAQSHYEQAQALAEEHNLPAVAGKAEARMGFLPALEEPVVFAEPAAAPSDPLSDASADLITDPSVQDTADALTNAITESMTADTNLSPEDALTAGDRALAQAMSGNDTASALQAALEAFNLATAAEDAATAVAGHIGLAQIAELQQDFDTAAAAYRAAINLAETAGLADLQAQAQAALDLIAGSE